MIARLIRLSLLLLLCTATACFAQVDLALDLPTSGVAGDTVGGLFGWGFPGGTLLPANVSVSFASSCNGTPLLSTTALLVSDDFYSIRTIGFALPSTLPAGYYALSVQGINGSGTGFTTNQCAWFTVLPQTGFVTSKNGRLMLGGRVFQFSGGNEAGLGSTNGPQIDQLLQVAARNQLQVLRIWTNIDIGTVSGAGSVNGIENGFYTQYWNGSAPAYNDGPTGLQNLDYAVYRAGQMGFKVVLTLTNNWTPGGGMDQYVEWAGDSYHDQFYTDEKIRGWYQAWVNHLVNHVNHYTGKAYKDDPTIMAWELANEPRCQGSGDYPTSSSCTTTTLSKWVDQQSAYLKSIDRHHLVAVGDEGYFCVPGSSMPYNGCSSGDDAAAFAAAPGIDLVGMHLYEQTVGSDTTFGTDYINQHIALGKSLHKPVYLGEYGLTIGNQRNLIYNNWEQTILHNGASGAIVWSIAGGEPGSLSAESEQNLGLADQAPLLNTIRNFAQESEVGSNLAFDPVADDQWATTTLNTPIALNPFENLLPYAGNTINQASLNLNPGGTAATSVHVFGGQFAAARGTVQFTPDNNFNGQAVAPFTVRDSQGNLSNTAYLNVTVQPTENVTYEIESFETGVDGWQGINPGDTATQSTQYATNGPHSLKVVVTQTGWFGIQFASPISLQGRPNLSLDLYEVGSSASTDLVIQTGNNYQWCQSGSWPWLTTNSETTITMQLTPAGTGCASPALGQIDAVFVYLVAGNTYYIDNLRADAVPVAQQPIVITSFESGTSGWGPQAAGGGTVAQESSFYTDGSHGLAINSTGNGGWFGADNLDSIDLSSKSGISWDIDTPNNGTSVNMQLVFGSNNTVCTGTDWGWADSSLSTQTVPFNTLSCPGGTPPDLTKVNGIWLYFSAGTYDIDYLRAQ